MDDMVENTAADLGFVRPDDQTTAPDRMGKGLPPHLVPLANRRWALWRWSALRGAGFPLVLVFKLADSGIAAEADELLKSEDRLQQIHRDALEAVKSELKGLWQNPTGASRERLGPLIEAVRLLGLEKNPRSLGPGCASVRAIEEFRQESDRVANLRRQWNRSFEEARARRSQAISEIARMRQFREAVIWQNRHAFQTGIKLLEEEPLRLNWKSRRHEGLVARYLQRYTTKNDAIGFFGPIVWAQLTIAELALTAVPGETLLAERQVYFEQWAIDQLASSLAEGPDIKPWLIPHRLPFIHLDETMLYRPGEKPVELFPALAAVLEKCKGDRAAKEIVTELIRQPEAELTSESEVYELLERLCARKLIAWGLEIPLAPYPERNLRTLIDRIEDPGIRQRPVQALDSLEAARLDVAQAAGNDKKLERALENLEATFVKLTGASANRAPGRTYAGRTLVYEDCRRNIEIHIGTKLIELLGPPLTLLLESARWLTFQTALVYRQLLDDSYETLAEQFKSATVDLPVFWNYAQAVLLAPPDASPEPMAHVHTEFHKRWTELLRSSAGQRHLEYTSSALEPQVRSLFPAPCAGWSFGRYHSADIMISATSVEAIQQDRYQFVLGELHVAMNTLRNPILLLQHPAREELIEAITLDLPQPCVVPIPPRTWQGITSRTYNALLPAHAWNVAFTGDACGVSGTRVLPIGDLVVEKKGHQLAVRTRDARLNVDIVEFFGEALSLLVAHQFKLAEPLGHTPRITIDRLVICRETWCFRASEIQFAVLKDEAACFVEVRRWAQRHGMPRFVFVKAPLEPKPFFVDLDSPILVYLFVKTVRQSKENRDKGEESIISITEMLPGPDQAWLTDAEGNHYTSEFRFVAVDKTIDSLHDNLA